MAGTSDFGWLVFRSVCLLVCQVAGLVAGVNSLVLLDACGFAFSVLVGCVTVWCFGFGGVV